MSPRKTHQGKVNYDQERSMHYESVKGSSGEKSNPEFDEKFYFDTIDFLNSFNRP